MLSFSGSPSLRSPTENSIASLVSAAAIVKAKSESEGESQTSSGEQHHTAFCIDLSIIHTYILLINEFHVLELWIEMSVYYPRSFGLL